MGLLVTVIEKLRSRTGFLTVPQVCELLTFHPVTVRDWIREGTLPAVRIANQWRIDPAELANWIGKRQVGQE
jgi:excisionase family DNA binding protein